MDRLAIVLLVVLWWVGCTPGEVEPPPSTSTTTAPLTTTIPPEPPDRAPSQYIQWTCHESKPDCTDRFEWAASLDNAYSQWRGHVDLQYLLDHGTKYLAGGSEELVAMTPAELQETNAMMADAEARGKRLEYRVLNEQHRLFDPDPLGGWHRSQVRKDVARTMRAELEGWTETYTDIADEFPAIPGCDSIRCKIGRME